MTLHNQEKNCLDKDPLFIVNKLHKQIGLHIDRSNLTVSIQAFDKHSIEENIVRV